MCGVSRRVPGAGLEPARLIQPTDFKSVVFPREIGSLCASMCQICQALPLMMWLYCALICSLTMRCVSTVSGAQCVVTTEFVVSPIAIPVAATLLSLRLASCAFSLRKSWQVNAICVFLFTDLIVCLSLSYPKSNEQVSAICFSLVR